MFHFFFFFSFLIIELYYQATNLQHVTEFNGLPQINFQIFDVRYHYQASVGLQYVFIFYFLFFIFLYITYASLMSVTTIRHPSACSMCSFISIYSLFRYLG